MSMTATSTAPGPRLHSDALNALNLASRRLVFWLLLTALVAAGFPRFWMIISSLKASGEFYQVPPTFLPRTWTLQNYRDLFAQTSFDMYFLNSLIVACTTTVISLVLGAFGAYSLSRFSYRAVRLFSRVTLLSYMLPEVLVVLPLYVYVVDLGMADTLASLIIANLAFTLPLALWYMRAYFNAIPVSLEESAMVDGCTRLQALRRVVLPLALPGMVSPGVFSFNHAWNEFLFALVFTSSERNKVLTLGLATWIGQDNIYSWGMLLAAAVLVTLPVLAFYALVQRKLTLGLAEGANKGEEARPAGSFRIPHPGASHTMRIHSVQAIPIEIPLDKDFGGSTYHVLKRCIVITRIRTEDGLVSEVYNGDNRDESATIARIVQDELAPLLVGEDASRIEYLWRKMAGITGWNRDRKLAMEAIACADTALWDLFGKACGVNVSTLLGGSRASMPIISIAGYYEAGKTLADLSREMEWLRDAGMAGCKVKVGGLSPREDAERVAAARDGAGKDFILVVDANRGWSVPDAILFSRLIEHLDIQWFEEPCHWHDDAAMMARVRQATSIPVNAGQSEYTSYGVRRLLQADAVDYVNFDASESGGITEWRRAAALCSVFNVRMAHHEEPHLAVHMLSGVAHGSYVECFADPRRDPIWAHMIQNRASVSNGIIHVPQGPGFGLVLDEKLVDKHRIG